MKLLSVLPNILLVVFCLAIAIYYYRVVRNVLAIAEGNEGVGAILFISIFLIFIWGYIKNNKKFTSVGHCLLLNIIWIFFNGLFFLQSPGDLLRSIIWGIVFFIPFFYCKQKQDFIFLSYSMLVVSIICIYGGYMGLFNTVMAFSPDISGTDEAEKVNVVALSIISLPFILYINKIILKIPLLIGLSLVCLLSARRMAIICMVLSYFCVIYDFRNQIKSKKYAKFLKMLGIISLGIIGFYAYKYLSGNFSEIWEFVKYRFTEMQDDGGSGRTEVWADVISKMGDKGLLEWLIGYGYQGVWEATGHTAAHNEFLEVLTDYGIVGLVLYSMLHVKLIKRVIFLFKTNEEYRFIYLMSYIVFFVYSMFGNMIIYPHYVLLIPIFWGMMDAKLVTKC